MADVMINVQDLRKEYGPVRAVDGISFQVRRGEVLGFLGPNGAGKTTTMKILTCFMAPTAGRAEVAGYDVYDHSLEVRRRIGYLPEDTPLYPEMNVLEYLDFIAEIRQLPRATRRQSIKSICQRCGLEGYIGRPIGELSKGYRQRVGLAQAMLHNPDVLILDEPTSGLDPNQKVEIRELIREVGKDHTVIFSTHILEEVEATCSRVVIIARGSLVADGTPEELQQRFRGQQRIQLEVDGPAERVKEAISRVDGVASVIAADAQGPYREAAKPAPVPGEAYRSGARFTVQCHLGKDVRGELFKAVVQGGWTLLELHAEAASLQHVFHELTMTGASGSAAATSPAPTEKAA
jgi:ABC-2 type transport system ATP-binding protein